MCGWFKAAATWASIWNRASCLASVPASRRQDFQGDPSAQRGLLGLVDDPHPTPADLAEQAEFAQGVRHRQVGERRGGPGPFRGSSAPRAGPGEARWRSGDNVGRSRRRLGPRPRVSWSRNSSATLATSDAIDVGAGVARCRCHGRCLGGQVLVHRCDSVRPSTSSRVRRRSRARP